MKWVSTRVSATTIVFYLRVHFAAFTVVGGKGGEAIPVSGVNT